MEPLYKEIAKQIHGTDWTNIELIVRKSNENQIIYHGIKQQEDLPSILLNGVEPRTTEVDGNPSSFWTSGTNLFTPYEDSSFFMRSGRLVREKSYVTFTLAMASYDSLNKRGLQIDDFKPNSNILIRRIVPPEEIVILTAQVKYSRPEEIVKSYHATYKLAIDAIVNQLEKGITPGKTINLR